MFLFRCFTGIWQTVVRATRWLFTHVQTVCSTVYRLVRGTTRWGWNLLQAAWRHPVVAAPVVLGLSLAWLVFGVTPLLSLVGLGVFLRYVGRYALRLLWRWMVGTTTSTRPAPVMPQRNGRSNPMPGPAVAGVS